MLLFHFKNTKGAIKRKVAFIIISVSIAIFAIGIFLVYMLGLHILKDALGNEYTRVAQLLLNHSLEALNSEVEDAQVYTTRPLWIDVINNVNLKYVSMSKKEIDRYMADMDKKWISAEKNDPLFMEYLQNRVSISMRDIVTTRGRIAELFITDKFGGLIASSFRTSDFYQADKDWWQKAYNNGKGNIYVGNEESDESSNKWVITIALPIKDADGIIIGILKYSVNIERIFGELRNFTIGKTGNALIVNNKGQIIYKNGGSSINQGLFTNKEIGELLLKKQYFTVLPKTRFNNRKTFIAYSEGRSSYISDKDMKWIAFIMQDALEMSGPLDIFVLQLIIVTGLIILLIIPVGIFFGTMITKPIIDLSTATERIISGDWSYKINVKTGDEIEEFADKFTLLIANLQNKQMELIKSKDVLEDLSKTLEAKVAERTKDLADAQEAALNMLEDLQEAKDSLQKINKELVKLDQLKSEFISTVSHELRTPLSIIKEGINLVLDKIPGAINEKQQNILAISKSNIDRLARIIDSLLDISKIEAGKVELAMGLIDLSDIAKHTASSFEFKIKEKGLDLRLDIDKSVGRVYADSDRITQVFTNLIGNAIKFTHKGYIEISCKDKKDVVACSISDSGVGISKEDLPKVFNKFQQFGRMAGAGEKGTGLGLSIAKGIMDMHHGSIDVKSEPGKGTTFTFALHKYTEGSFFREYVDKITKQAIHGNAEMSVIMICFKALNKDDEPALRKKIHDAMTESIRLIRKNLFRETDDVIKDDGELLVILPECGRAGARAVENRIKNILTGFLKDQAMYDKISLKFGCATYPSDTRNVAELIEKARYDLVMQMKTEGGRQYGQEKDISGGR